MTNNLCTPKEASEITGISEYKIKKLFDEHKILGYKNDKGHRKIDMDFLIEFLANKSAEDTGTRHNSLSKKEIIKQTGNCLNKTILKNSFELQKIISQNTCELKKILES